MQYEDSGEFFLHFPELKNDFETVKNDLEVLYVPKGHVLKGSGHVM